MEDGNLGSNAQPTKPILEFDLNEAPPWPDEPQVNEWRLFCESCGKLASGDIMECCECGGMFHLECLGVKERLREWKCFKCSLKVVNDKPSSSVAASGGSGGEVGVFDMNAHPLKETDEEREGFVTAPGPGPGTSNMQDTRADGFVERTLDFPVTPVPNSASVCVQQNRLNSDGGKVMDGPLNRNPQASDNAPMNTPNYISSHLYLKGLRDHVSKSGNELGEGWHVDFVFCNNKIQTFPVYCSPDGSKFDTKENVVKYLRSLSNWKSSDEDNSSVATFPEKAIHTNKRLTMNEIKKLSRSRGARSHEIINFNGSHDNNNRGVAIDLDPLANGSCASKKILDDFPVQFEDFFVMSVGKIDPRPSFHTVCEIWPVGYRSIWHDRFTGSVFVSQVLDRGDSGPVFRVRRLPCAKQSIPNASTVIWRPKVGLNNGTNKVASDNSDISKLVVDDDMSIQMMLTDCSPPHLDNVLSCGGPNHDFQKVSCLTTDNFGSGDVICEFFVDGSSPASAWEMVSENLIGACRKVYDETGSFKFGCKHRVDGGDLYPSELFDSLSKFCYYANPMKNIPGFILSATELDASCEVLSKWIRLDRFGLDMGFVQELIEQLPGVNSCSKYQSLSKRVQGSDLQTVGSGVLVAKRKNDLKVEKESDSLIESCRRPNPSGKQLSSKLPQKLVGDVLQACDFSWRFSEVLHLKAPFSLPEIEDELINPWLDPEKSLNKSANEIEHVGKRSSCTGALLTNSHTLLLKVVIGELLSKVAPHVKPNLDSGETKIRKGKKKDVENSVVTEKKTKLDVLLPMNELTWPELARRYVLAVLSMDGIDSAEMIRESGKVTAEIAREFGKVFHCLNGDGGVLCGSLTGVAAMEADAVLLAEASKKIFGSIGSKYDVVSITPKETDLTSSVAANVTDKEIPEWAQVLEPVRKLPTNVGARIRNCIYKALEKNPPEWAVAILKQSISKEVYKGNASGPTKRMVLSVLERVTPEDTKAKPEKKDKVKKVKTFPEIVMKQCRITLRHAISADKDRVFSNLLGRALGNDEKGLLGYPAMVSRPLDFRTVDIRLTAGVYGESHEAFIEDIREVWQNIRTAYGDRPEFSDLVETLSKKSENLYEEEIIALINKVLKSEDSKDNVDNMLAYTSERSLPKAPWEDGVCKVCGLDKDDDSVLLCDRCDSEYHTYCLDPPLARIPDGNWYCPNCDSSQTVQQDGLCGTRLIRPAGRKRRVQREFTEKMLETLAHLADMMELNEYWELAVEERVFLLKYLCDEALSSSIIHDYLDHCASVCADTHIKLRSFTSELKHLKSREDILVTNSAKSKQNTCSGEMDGGKLTNGSIKNEQLLSKNLEDSPDTNGPQNQLSSFLKSVSEKPSSSGCSQMQLELTGENGESNSNLPESNHGSEAYQLELSSVENEVSSLRNSIENLESQTHKTAIRKEFLGRDAAGRLYWAFGSPGTCQKIIVSESWMVREGKEIDLVDPIEFTCGDLKNLDGKKHSSWTCFESDAEINELLGWLKDDDAREMELKEAIVQLGRNKPRDSSNAPNHLQNNVERSSCDHENVVRSDFPLTKAKTVLEKMFGSCLEYGTRKILESQRTGDKITFDSRLYKCECLELIRPSRHHCLICHRTFFTTDDLEEHRNGNCKLFSLKILEGPSRQENEGSSKGKRKILEGPTRQKSLDPRKKGKDESKGDMQRNLSVPKNNQNVSDCPYNFEEIKSKFVTKNSLKETVSDIGLIGSGGVPSFLPQTSISSIDPALFVKNPTRKNIANSCGVSTVAETLQQQFNIGENKRVDSGMNEPAKAERFKPKGATGNSQRNKRSVLGIDKSRIICQSSLRPLVGKVTQILRQLKINLLEMDAALPEEALRPSRTSLEKRFLWRAFVKSAVSIYEMIQATIVLEDMIKSEYLKNDWWYWSSPTAAAKVSTVSALALRIYALDAAIIYEKKSSPSNVNKAETPARSSKTDKKLSQNSNPQNNAKDRSPPLALAFNLKKGKQSKKKILDGEV